jgi:hypothetical protein
MIFEEFKAHFLALQKNFYYKLPQITGQPRLGEDVEIQMNYQTLLQEQAKVIVSPVQLPEYLDLCRALISMGRYPIFPGTPIHGVYGMWLHQFLEKYQQQLDERVRFIICELIATQVSMIHLPFSGDRGARSLRHDELIPRNIFIYFYAVSQNLYIPSIYIFPSSRPTLLDISVPGIHPDITQLRLLFNSIFNASDPKQPPREELRNAFDTKISPIFQAPITNANTVLSAITSHIIGIFGIDRQIHLTLLPHVPGGHVVNNDRGLHSPIWLSPLVAQPSPVPVLPREIPAPTPHRPRQMISLRELAPFLAQPAAGAASAPVHPPAAGAASAPVHPPVETRPASAPTSPGRTRPPSPNQSITSRTVLTEPTRRRKGWWPFRK